MAKGEIVVLYGSQTGQAETIAETIHEAAEEQEIKSTLLCLQKAEEAFKIVSEGSVTVIFVCSTTGDGELPGNARKFVRMLQRRTLENDHLSALRYALLGLGDSNYSTFCGGPKTLQRTLKKLGAESFYAPGFADDGTDLEIVVEPWIEGLWPALKSHIKTRCSQQKVEVVKENGICDELEKINISATSNEGLNSDKSNDEHFVDKKLDFSLDMGIDSPLNELSSNFEGNLTPVMQRYLTHKLTEENIDFSGLPHVPYPLAVDEKIHIAKIASIDRLTTDDAVKTAFCVTLDIEDDFLYEPGDSFGVIVQNPKEETDWLMKRLKVETYCDKTIELMIDPKTTKRNAKVPNFVPKKCTIRHVLENCLEIRSVPKRTFLRALLDCTTAENDRNILRQLCNKDSMSNYIKYVRTPNLNCLDILATLASCQPPFELLVEHLPRLKARSYSATSCFQANPGKLRFVFNVVDFTPTDCRMYSRKGVCTGYLQSLADNLPLLVNDRPKLTIFKTKNESFRLPLDVSKPIIMIGPGTGVAPYLGFLEKLQVLKTNDIQCGETWLFFGCRHKAHDFLFQNELNLFVENGTLGHLVTCFSRDTPPLDGEDSTSPKYVQDNLKLHTNEIFQLIFRRDAIVYVCGDAKNMAKDVRETIIDILAEEMPLEVAIETHKNMVKEGRYKEDVWT